MEEEEADEFQEKMFEFLVLRIHKYLILKFDENHKEAPFVFSSGSEDSTYNQMEENLCDTKHGIGLIWVEVENVNRLEVIKFVEDDVDETTK